MQTLILKVEEALNIIKREVNQLKHKRECVVNQLCEVNNEYLKSFDELSQLESDYQLLMWSERDREARVMANKNTNGTTNGPGANMFKVGADLDTRMTGNCNAAQASGRGPVFHEQNDSVDTH